MQTNIFTRKSPIFRNSSCHSNHYFAKIKILTVCRDFVKKIIISYQKIEFPNLRFFFENCVFCYPMYIFATI